MKVRLDAPVAGLSLWLIDLDSAKADESVLSPQERQRMSRFNFERDAQRYGRARSELRRLLGQHLGLRPESIRFREGAHGKPHLDLERHAVPFSVSHSQGLAVVAIGERLPVGVDIEAVRGDDPVALEGLARSVLTPGEMSNWLVLEHDARRRAFYDLWSAKEACLKSVGCGLYSEPRGLEVGWAPEARDVVVPVNGAPAMVRLFPLPSIEGCAAAVALTHSNSAHLSS